MNISQYTSNKKIPRFIYHMTNRKNYNAILNDGFIKMGAEKLHIDKGIYAFDLINFFKHWKSNKDWGYDDLQRIILRHIVSWFSLSSQGKGDLVILRIPTSNLDKDKLFVRSLNKLFKFEESEEKFCNISETLKEHLTGKTPAKEAPLYKMRKEAIEFIYRDNIPIKNVEKIGNIVNIASLRKDIKFGINPIKFIMENLLTGTSEAKGIKLIK